MANVFPGRAAPFVDKRPGPASDERQLARQRELAFLREHLPESDLACCPEEVLGAFVDHALFLRETAPWCAELEWEIFEHYVLFPRVNDEDLSFHRRTFYDALWPRVRGLAKVEEMVLEVNRWCHEWASYQAQDPRTASPLTVFRCGSGRCGEESAFLVSALRSVGIPARQVYVPRWAHCDDNHAWAEALCGGRWRFLGACEPEPVLDRGWFNTAASRAVLVHSRLFGMGSSPLHGEPLGREGAVRWYNQTARYAPVRAVTFRAVAQGRPAAGAKFRLQLLNEAGFHTIAALEAGEDGTATAELGLGSVHVTAAWRGLWAEGDCHGDGLTLRLLPPEEAATAWKSLDAVAPEASGNAAALDPGQRAARAAVLAAGNALRQQRTAAFDRLSGNPAWDDLLREARGNRPAIAAFLERDGNPLRQRLLRTLSRKDLRDVTEETLEDHLTNAPPPGEIPEDVYDRYVLCPRIELEPLTPWRGVLRQELAPADPRQLWRDLNRRVDTSPGRTYANLVWTPAESWRSHRCDRRSLKLLYVACLRAMGIPARLRELDGAPEYWAGGDFHTPEPEETGVLELRCETHMVYGQTFTLSRWTGDGWAVLTLPEGAKRIPLSAGRYRLITATRLPNGSQYAALREFPIRPGRTETTNLYRRPFDLEGSLFCQNLPALPAVTPEGETVPDLFKMMGRPAILIWAEPGAEPTAHLLGELAQARQTLTAAVVLLAREKSGLEGPDVRVLLDDWDYDLELVARQLNCSPDTPPFAVVCDSRGRAVYAVGGYRAGSAALLIRAAECVAAGEKQRSNGAYPAEVADRGGAAKPFAEGTGSTPNLLKKI